MKRTSNDEQEHDGAIVVVIVAIVLIAVMLAIGASPEVAGNYFAADATVTPAN